MSRPVCNECFCVEDETGCGCMKNGQKIENESFDRTANHMADVYVSYSEPKDAATTLRHQQLRIDQLLETQDYLYKKHDEQQTEIEALKTENKVLRKGELWLGMVYNNRGNGIAPMYLENFMRFCEKNGFTEESGYKLFKEQEK